MECLDAVTRERRYVLCAVGRAEGGHIVMTPFGHLADGNPFDAYLPPDPDDPNGFISTPDGGDCDMITVEEILAADLRCPPSQRSLPWPETRNGVTVVVEPKPHWAADMAAFRLQDRSWCYYADWIENGPAARFFDHPETSGSDVMTNAHAMLAREIAQGLWRM